MALASQNLCYIAFSLGLFLFKRLRFDLTLLKQALEHTLNYCLVSFSSMDFFTFSPALIFLFFSLCKLHLECVVGDVINKYLFLYFKSFF